MDWTVGFVWRVTPMLVRAHIGSDILYLFHPASHDKALGPLSRAGIPMDVIVHEISPYIGETLMGNRVKTCQSLGGNPTPGKLKMPGELEIKNAWLTNETKRTTFVSSQRER